MEVTAAVLYNGSLAHYDVQVTSENGGRSTEGGETTLHPAPSTLLIARLSSFNGNPSNTPPSHLKLRKEGRHWVSSDVQGHLADDLGYAVELKAKPLLEGRRRDGGHPAG